MIYLANLGGTNSPPNGQVAKSRQLSIALEKLQKEDALHVINVGLSYFKLFDFVSKFQRHQHIVITLGKNGIIVAAGLCWILEHIFGKRKRLIYIAPGGWLADFINSSVVALFLMRRFDQVLVEAHELVQQLKEKKVKAAYIRNMRDSSPKPPRQLHSSSMIKLCFSSRVTADKGIFLAIDLVNRLNECGRPALLDIFGPINNADLKRFNTELARSPQSNYRGYFSSERESSEILEQYDWLLLPTSYMGECVPGIIIESYFAATPVLTTRWRFLHEVVKNGNTGYLFPVHEYVDSALRVIVECLDNSAKFFELSRNCHNEAVSHQTSENLQVLRQIIYE